MSSERFDKAAADWDTKTRRVKLAQVIAEAIGSALPLNKDMIGLEYGCGTGLVTFAVAEQVGAMYGLDSSVGMIEVLKEKATSSGVTNVTPFHGQLADFHVPLDLIIFSMTLHHIKEYQAALAECYAHLTPGGFLAIADLEAEDGSFHKDNEGIAHFGFDLSDLCQVAQDVGFIKTQAKAIHHLARNEREYPIFLLTAQKE